MSARKPLGWRRIPPEVERLLSIRAACDGDTSYYSPFGRELREKYTLEDAVVAWGRVEKEECRRWLREYAKRTMSYTPEQLEGLKSLKAVLRRERK